MSVGRAYRAQATAPVADPKGRVYRAQATGTGPTTGKGRVYRTQFTGTAATVLLPLTDVACEPLTSVPLTATLAPLSATPDSYSWRRISGPSVSIVGTGASVTVKAPAALAGATVVIGVKATTAGVDSVERTCTITTPTCQFWAPTSTGLVAMYAPVAV